MGLEFSAPWESVLDDSRGPEWTTWFVGGKVSIARNCVHRWAEPRPTRSRRSASARTARGASSRFAELSREVTRLAEALVALGVEPGDRVALFLPMSPEVAIASHACAHIGAIQVPIFSGFAAPAVAQRLQASEAKVVITQRESSRRGKADADARDPRGGAREAPSVEHVVARAVRARRQLPGELPALEVDSETPYLLTYTSGTTGEPKGVVHVQGGFLVSIAREACYQADVHAGDVAAFATDMGWIMGPWTVVGVGALGGTIVFAEGAPDWPRRTGSGGRSSRSASRRSASRRRSPARCSRTATPRTTSRRCARSSRRGEPWNPEPYRWLFENVGGSRVPIINFSGGTEVGACFLSPVPSGRSRRARSAGRRSAWRWTSSTTTATRSSAPARSASSSAAGRSPA